MYIGTTAWTLRLRLHRLTVRIKCIKCYLVCAQLVEAIGLWTQKTGYKIPLIMMILQNRSRRWLFLSPVSISTFRRLLGLYILQIRTRIYILSWMQRKCSIVVCSPLLSLFFFLLSFLLLLHFAPAQQVARPPTYVYIYLTSVLQYKYM